MIHYNTTIHFKSDFTITLLSATRILIQTYK